MKRNIYILLFFSFSILLSACSKEEERSNIPNVPFRFNLNLGSSDNHLNNGAGFINVYINTADKNQYDALLSGLKQTKSYIAPRIGSDSQQIGFSGLLVINIGIPIDGLTTPLCAFDLCCPHESQRDIRIIPTDDMKAKCPKCGSIYNLLEGGRPISGPVDNSKRLRPYQINQLGDKEFQVVNKFLQ